MAPLRGFEAMVKAEAVARRNRAVLRWPSVAGQAARQATWQAERQTVQLPAVAQQAEQQPKA